MNKVLVLILLTALLMSAARAPSVSAQPAHQPSGAVASLARGELPQTITGRVTRLDANSGTFSVRAGDNGQVVDLIARKDLIARLRRGERVIVTYEGKKATKIQATSSEK